MPGRVKAERQRSFTKSWKFKRQMRGASDEHQKLPHFISTQQDRFKGESMRTIVQTILICFFVPTIVLFAQEHTSAAAASPTTQLIDENEGLYDGITKILRRSAELMPEENYGFRPTDQVRSFGGIVGHVADAQYIFCSKVLGEPNPSPKVEQTTTSKADLIAALDAAFAYCGRAYAALTDTTATGKVNLMGSEKTKLGVLSVNQVHTIEHYGNLVTYLRMNDIVPPTSDREFMQQLQKK